MNTIRPHQNTTSVETLVDMHCSRLLFSGLHSTLLESPTEAAASQAVSILRANHHIADYRFNEKRSEWHVTVKH